MYAVQTDMDFSTRAADASLRHELGRPEQILHCGAGEYQMHEINNRNSMGILVR